MGNVGEDVAQAIRAVQDKSKEVQTVQNKMQIDLTAALDGTSEFTLLDPSTLLSVAQFFSVCSAEQYRVCHSSGGLRSPHDSCRSS